ncbi:MAG: Mov34/MPN/PAD-1 family protein [Nitrososphaerota archaeon]
MKARIYPLALGKILKHSLTNLEREVIGLLIGKMQGQVLEIWDAVTGEQYGKQGFVELNEEIQAQIAEKLQKEKKGLTIVGWYHSHPGLGVFLSGTDISTQKIYQKLYPKAVALVIDPLLYSKTKEIMDIKFKIFRIGKNDRVITVPTTIGIRKSKLLESTIYAMDTLDLRHIIDIDSNQDALKVDKNYKINDNDVNKYFLKEINNIEYFPNSFKKYILLKISKIFSKIKFEKADKNYMFLLIKFLSIALIITFIIIIIKSFILSIP